MMAEKPLKSKGFGLSSEHWASGGLLSQWMADWGLGATTSCSLQCLFLRDESPMPILPVANLLFQLPFPASLTKGRTR
jgi:hypothetical protein